MGVEHRFYQRSPVGFWWIAQSQPELPLQCANSGEKETIGLPTFLSPLSVSVGSSAEVSTFSAHILGAQGFTVSALLQGGVWKQLLIAETWAWVGADVSGAASWVTRLCPQRQPHPAVQHPRFILVPSHDREKVSPHFTHSGAGGDIPRALGWLMDQPS